MLNKKIFIISILLVIFSCSELIVHEPESDSSFEDFRSAWQIVESYYPFLKFKKINWDSLYLIYEPKAEVAKGDEIFSVLYDLLGELRDGHIEIITKGGFPVPAYLWPRFADHKLFSQSVVAGYLRTPLLLSGNNNIGYGMLTDKIGYIYFSTFKKGDWIRGFDDVIKYFGNTKGLVIDVRNNGGGSSSVYDYVISHLIDAPIEQKWFLANGEQKSQFIQPASDFRYLQPIVILINGASFSAAEIFPELMRQLPNVTLVGDTTGGGGGDPEIFQLPSGKKIKIPVKYVTRLDDKMIEWNGIVPDIVVEQTESDIKSKRDKQLESAVQLLTKSVLRNLRVQRCGQKLFFLN